MLPVHLHTPSPTASATDGARPIRLDRSCNMRTRRLGALEVSELGFGTLSFASTYGQAPEKAESIRTIRGAHDLGVTIATKFGFDVDPTTGERRGLSSQP